ncbi:response regulator transcription factor [Roseovarius nitratireducens]|uniref:response regulator transcription factor n=1 Tax=Roseovarius nitratireducens TaxID=2044597 RepID=UPI001F0BF965|nr:response regulator transcription factor [Roseovarius nitratireducens]
MVDLTAMILDDDRAHTTMVAGCLSNEGFRLAPCHKALNIPTAVKRKAVDIYLVGDRALGRDGFDVVRELRNDSTVGILMLRQSADEIDAILALEMGADDCMVKPVRPRELSARVHTILRRTVVTPAEVRRARPGPGDFLRQVDDIEICDVLRLVRVGKRPVKLSKGEFDVLMLLAGRTNEVLSRERIIAAARGGGRTINDRAVDGIINRLRRKLFADAEAGARRIRTVQGRGYMLIERD